MLASNPPRNSRSEAHRSDEQGGDARIAPPPGSYDSFPMPEKTPCPPLYSALSFWITYPLNLSLLWYFLLYIESRRAGSVVASRPLPGLKHGPRALDSCSLGASFPSRLGPSHLYGFARLSWSP